MRTRNAQTFPSPEIASPGAPGIPWHTRCDSTPGRHAVAPESGAEAERLFTALSAGGRVEMALQQTAWAEKFGTCADRFGVQWMVSYAGKVQFNPGQG